MQVTTLLTKADEKPPEKPSAEAIAEKQAAVDERVAALDRLRAVRLHCHELCCPATAAGRRRRGSFTTDCSSWSAPQQPAFAKPASLDDRSSERIPRDKAPMGHCSVLCTHRMVPASLGMRGGR